MRFPVWSVAAAAFTAAAVFSTQLRAQQSAPQIRAGRYVCGILRGVALCNTRLWNPAMEDSGLSPIPGDPGLVSLEMSFASACGLTRAGELYCIGSGPHPKYGPYTTNTVFARPCVAESCSWELVRVAAPLTFRSIGYGGFVLCGVTLAGPTYCWGRNDDHQLGNPALRRQQTLTPQRVMTNIALTSLVNGGLYGDFNCGLTAQGKAWCWGQVSYSDSGDHVRPIPVAPNLTFTSLAATTLAACGLTADGSAWCWGQPPGDNHDNREPVPMQPGFRFRALVLDSDHACGITTQGPTVCWGQGAPQPVMAGGGRAFVGLAMNNQNEVVAVTADEVVYAWTIEHAVPMVMTEPRLVPFAPAALRPSPGSKAPGSRPPKSLAPRPRL